MYILKTYSSVDVAFRPYPQILKDFKQALDEQNIRGTVSLFERDALLRIGHHNKSVVGEGRILTDEDIKRPLDIKGRRSIIGYFADINDSNLAQELEIEAIAEFAMAGNPNIKSYKLTVTFRSRAAIDNALISERKMDLRFRTKITDGEERITDLRSYYPASYLVFPPGNKPELVRYLVCQDLDKT